MSLIRDVANYLIFNDTKRDVKIGRGNFINKGTFFEGYNRIGDNNAIKGAFGLGTYIGSNCRIDAKVGRFCSISNDVIVLSTDHPLSFVSTSPSFYSVKGQNGLTFTYKNQYKEELLADETHSVIIGNDVLISYGVFIKGGVTIGDGAVLGANSVITHDVDPYTIVAGNPAKVIRKRFEDESIDVLLDMKWWDWPLEKIKDNSSKFFDLGALIQMEDVTK